MVGKAKERPVKPTSSSRRKRVAKSFLMSLLLLVAIPGTARAASAIELSAVPFGSGPTSYPLAFSGFGFGLVLEKYIQEVNSGISAKLISYGSATLYQASYKQYLLSGPQLLIKADENSEEPISVSSKHWSMFAEGGGNFYSMTKVDPSDKTSKILASGIGVQFALGAEYPLFYKIFATMRLNYFNAVGLNGVNAFYVDLSFGRPFSF